MALLPDHPRPADVASPADQTADAPARAPRALLPARRPGAPLPPARQALRVAARRAGRPLRPLLQRDPRGAWLHAVAVALLAPGAPRVPLELPRTLEALRRGFLPTSHVLYALDRNDPSEYLTDRQREGTRGLDGPAAVLLADKVAFTFMLASLGAPTPALEAVLTRGRLHPLAGGDGPGWLRKRLDSGAPLVIKPATGGGGGGVLVLRGGPRGPVVNGEPTTWEGLHAHLATLDHHVATAFVRQAAYARRIQPASTNTMRLLTMTDDRGIPFLAGAYHRFGSARSVPVDNWAQGGLSVRVDPETGELGPGALFPTDGEVRWASHHPETGEAIAGTLVPGWERIRDEVLALAGRLRFIPYVGWDVVATDDGYTVLEGNHYSNVGFQVHGGLLRDPRVRDFYRRHGIVA